MSKENHSFSVAVANEVGVYCALILQHLCFLQKALVANGENWQEKWVKRSVRSMKETYSYLSEKEIRGAKDRLERDGYVVSKIDNEQKGDRTKSFRLTQKGLAMLGIPFAKRADHLPKGQMTFPKRANDIVPKGQMLIKEDYTSFNELVGIAPTAAAPENTRLEAEKEKPLAAGAGGGFGRVDRAAELERLRTNHTAREQFFTTYRIPAAKFDEYLSLFSKHLEVSDEPHPNRAKFVNHFYNWSRVHYEIETKSAGQPGASPAILEPSPYRRPKT